MKLSVSVPDELWDQAKDLDSDLNPSHMVQEALRRWVEQAGRKPVYSTARPQDVESAFEGARGRLAQEARAQFERGYRAGVVAAGKLPFSNIETLAEQYRFNVERWARAIADAAVAADMHELPPGFSGPNPETFSALLEGLGASMSPYGDDMFSPGPVYVKGFAQTFRDLWSSVAEGGED